MSSELDKLISAGGAPAFPRFRAGMLLSMKHKCEICGKEVEANTDSMLELVKERHWYQHYLRGEAKIKH